MAQKKYNRKSIGSVIKSNDPTKPNYMKFNLYQTGGVLTLKDGQTLSVESKKFQQDSLSAAIKAGRISEESAEKVQARIDKIPDFVLGEIILLEKNEEA